MEGLTLASGGIIPQNTENVSGAGWSESRSECPAELLFAEEPYGKGYYQSLLSLISVSAGASA